MAEVAKEGGDHSANDRSSVQPATRLLSLAGIVAALGAASCCVIPFLLFAAGVSGAWITDCARALPAGLRPALTRLHWMGRLAAAPQGEARLRRRPLRDSAFRSDRADRSLDCCCPDRDCTCIPLSHPCPHRVL